MKLTPPKLTPQELANLSDSHSLLFFGRQLLDVPAYTEAVQSTLTSKWMEMLEGQEAVGSVYTMEALGSRDGPKFHASLSKPLPAGTKLYAAPVPAKAPMMPTLDDGRVFEVRIAGPDDVIVFSDELEALQRANDVNKQFVADCLKHPDDHVLCVATVHDVDAQEPK